MKTVILILLSLSQLCWLYAQEFKLENRSSIINYLKYKIDNKMPLIVHALVPLCDNEHQGIVPTSPSLGNGLDLKSNLYWATSAGIKRYFNSSSDWKMQESIMNPSQTILERVVFKKTYSNGAIVYFIADAYRGDRMHECLNDYFNSLSGHLNATIIIGKDTLQINGQADMVAFNGHNGLMDETTVYQSATENTKPKDAVSISCVSSNYFKTHYSKTNSYPLVHTTGLLYPGAFILKGIIDQWVLLKSDKECKTAAGKAYYENKPKSGPNGSQNLFNFGWI
jgi:uncharacterized Zn-binding protein involved in type VI secretion